MTLPLPPVVLSAGLLVLSNMFMSFAVFCLRAPLRLDHLWSGLCLPGAVYFAFRGGVSA